MPAAKEGDQIVAIDTHIVILPPPAPPQALPHPFAGKLNGGLSSNVKIMGKPAATAGSTADNSPAHVPTVPGAAFQRSPANKGTVKTGSATVTINGKAAARGGDTAETCNDPADLPAGTVTVTGPCSVIVG
jgi:uncharacterized Zn-binding protein involved in type VI secretion